MCERGEGEGEGERERERMALSLLNCVHISYALFPTSSHLTSIYGAYDTLAATSVQHQKRRGKGLTCVHTHIAPTTLEYG